MNPIISVLILGMSFFLVAMLNIILKKSSKHGEMKILWQHYLFGYFFILYIMITLVLMVGIPSLSEMRMCLKLNKPIFNPNINLVPFKDSFEITSLFNVILFMPFGFLLPTLWKRYRKLWPTFWYGLFFSIIIEVSQLFARYRSSDINDLIFNTLGTVFGWIIFNIMKKIFCKLADKTMVESLSEDSLAIKLEPHIYIVIAIVCSFCQ